MESDLYEFVQTRLLAIRPRSEWAAIADEAKVPYGTLYRYAHGYTQRPSYMPLKSIADALKAREGE